MGTQKDYIISTSPPHPFYLNTMLRNILSTTIEKRAPPVTLSQFFFGLFCGLFIALIIEY